MEQLTDAFIICVRSKSSRVPYKALHNINGMPVIEHLVTRLLKLKIPIIIATGSDDADKFLFLNKYSNVYFYNGEDENPLGRMYNAAKKYGVKNIIRVTHDKIFVALSFVSDFMEYFKRNLLDYVYSSNFIAGTGFEIISFSALEKAAQKFGQVEHISYAIKAVTNNYENKILTSELSNKDNKQIRLLIDYPKDIDFITLLISILGLNCSLESVVNYLKENPHLNVINKLKECTVYTCVYNGQKYLSRCIESVIKLDNFERVQYIIIDDGSTDKTSEIIADKLFCNSNIKYIRNSKNIGLASSSNLALKHSECDYIIRIDADDYFLKRNSVSRLLHTIKIRGLDAIYPNNYYGNLSSVQMGKEQHHVGGAIFKTSVINHIKFTEGLRHYDGLDWFERAKDQINIGYLNEPIFFYRQHKDSLSKSELDVREKIKGDILNGQKMA